MREREKKSVCECARERERGGEKERQKVKFSRSAIEVKRPFQFGLSGKKMNLALFFCSCSWICPRS